MECEYCKKKFSSRGVLNNHQKTAKYCLKLREEKEIISDNYSCEFCSNTFSRKHHLENHSKICKHKFYNELQIKLEENQKLHEKDVEKYKENITKLENYISKLEEQNQKLYEKDVEKYKENITNLEDYISKLEEQNQNLQNQIKELATIAIEKPNKTINNNSNSNNKNIDNRTVNMVPFNLTQEKVLDIMKDKFQEKHLLRGQEGLADFFVENILITHEKKFLYKCADPSRNHFIFVDEEGKVQKDINAKHLTHIINEPVKQRTREIYQECADRYFDNIDYDDENNDGTDTTEADKLNYIGDKVVEIASLKNNNTKFVKGLIPSLLKKN